MVVLFVVIALFGCVLSAVALASYGAVISLLAAPVLGSSLVMMAALWLAFGRKYGRRRPAAQAPCSGVEWQHGRARA